MLHTGRSTCILTLSFLGAYKAAAQTTTATMFGIVRDTSGAVIPGVHVTVTNVSTSLPRTATMDDAGSYVITNLPVGQYSLVAEKEGFRRFVQESITLEVNQNARVDVALTVGQLTESISVTADAMGVDTRSSTVGEVVDRVGVQELPLNGRNAMELARIVPGVARTSAPTAIAQARSGPAVIVGGGRDTENELRFEFERLGKLQFRAEFFNLFNSVNFGQPVLLLNNRNFGGIQTAGDPRIVQFALRYAF